MHAVSNQGNKDTVDQLEGFLWILSMYHHYKCKDTSTRCLSPPDISSHSLPGVPTIISGLAFRSLSCFSVDIPPTIGTTRKLVHVAAFFRWSVTWKCNRKNQKRIINYRLFSDNSGVQNNTITTLSKKKTSTVTLREPYLTKSKIAHISWLFFWERPSHPESLIWRNLLM